MQYSFVQSYSDTITIIFFFADISEKSNGFFRSFKSPKCVTKAEEEQSLRTKRMESPFKFELLFFAPPIALDADVLV